MMFPLLPRSVQQEQTLQRAKALRARRTGLPRFSILPASRPRQPPSAQPSHRLKGFRAAALRVEHRAMPVVAERTVTRTPTTSTRAVVRVGMVARVDRAATAGTV